MLAVVKDVCERHSIWAFDERTHKGSLRHINARFSFAKKQVLVTLVINMRASNEEEFQRSPLGKKLQRVAEEIRDELPEIIGVCVNLNSEKGNKILGDETVCVSGVSRIEEVLKTEREDYPELLQNGVEFSLSSTQLLSKKYGASRSLARICL